MYFSALHMYYHLGVLFIHPEVLSPKYTRMKIKDQSVCLPVVGTQISKNVSVITIICDR